MGLPRGEGNLNGRKNTARRRKKQRMLTDLTTVVTTLAATGDGERVVIARG